MLDREDWLPIARKLDWEYSYVREEEVFPEAVSGAPWLAHDAWRDWDEPFRTSYREYVDNQHAKDADLYAVREAVGRVEGFQRQPAAWLNGIKLHAATLPLAEFAAVVGELRGARFGRNSAWRAMATLGALDELRHTHIPLVVMHDLVRHEPQFDWTHRFFYTEDWVAVAARHLVDELLLGSSAIDFALGTNFVFETGFTNLQFVGLAAIAHKVGDHIFEKMVKSIQTDEARHAQIGVSTLRVIAARDPERAQYLIDKWFWRTWLFFAVVTGFTMDYLTPLDRRAHSFKEFTEEWIVDQYLRSLADLGMKKPWYWELFLDALETYHHMVYASAYTYRHTVWFDFVIPGPEERAWLRRKYPSSWDALEPVWERIAEGWRSATPGDERAAHGEAMVGFCSLCQLVLCQGTPGRNAAVTLEHDGRRYVFCSEPCRWIFQQEPERYASHRGIDDRVLEGAAPADLEGLLDYFGLTPETRGRDAFGGDYPWL